MVIIIKNSKDIYEQMIDLALDTNDFEWIKQIHKQRETELLNKKEEVKWYSRSVALENITNNMAVLESRGIRNLRYDSDYDMTYSTLIQTEKQHYLTGEQITYNMMTEEVRLYLFGYVKGYQEAHKPFSPQQCAEQSELNVDTNKQNKNKKRWLFWKSS